MLTLAIAVALVVVLLTWLRHYYTSTFTYWKDRNVEYVPNPKAFYGSLKDVVTKKVSLPTWFENVYNEYKKKGVQFVGMFMYRKPTLLIIDPVLIRDILIKNFPAFHDRTWIYDEHFDPMSANLISLEGERWKFLRARLSPTFTVGRLKATFELVEEASRGLPDVFKDACDRKLSLDIIETMSQFTTDVIASSVFGLDLHESGEIQSEFRKMRHKIFILEPWRRLFMKLTTMAPWLYKVFRIPRFNAEITSYFIRLFAETVDFRKSNNISRNDFLQLLSALRDVNITDVKDLEEMKGVANYNMEVELNLMELSDKLLAAQLFIFFIAGFETSSTTMSFALHELALHPEIQERAASEIEKAISEYGGINFESISNMKYIDMIIHETLRKYPPVPTLTRSCTQPYKIPNTDTTIGSDVSIFISVYNLHHDEQYYPNPEKFDPERFSDEKKNNIVRGTFLPFGDGPRICIGMKFAMMEMKIGFAKILPKFRVGLSANSKPMEFRKGTLVLAPLHRIRLDVEARR